MFPTGLGRTKMTSRSYPPQLPSRATRTPARRFARRPVRTAPQRPRFSWQLRRRCQDWRSRPSSATQRRRAKPCTAPPGPSARSTTGDILSEVSIWARLFLPSHSRPPPPSPAWTISCTPRSTWKSAPATAAAAAPPAAASRHRGTGPPPKEPLTAQSANRNLPQRNQKPSENSTLKTRWRLLLCSVSKSKRGRWRGSRGRPPPEGTSLWGSLCVSCAKRRTRIPSPWLSTSAPASSGSSTGVPSAIRCSAAPPTSPPTAAGTNPGPPAQRRCHPRRAWKLKWPKSPPRSLSSQRPTKPKTWVTETPRVQVCPSRAQKTARMTASTAGRGLSVRHT